MTDEGRDDRGWDPGGSGWSGPPAEDGPRWTPPPPPGSPAPAPGEPPSWDGPPPGAPGGPGWGAPSPEWGQPSHGWAPPPPGYGPGPYPPIYTYGYGQPPVDVPDYLIQSILVTVLCGCWPLGIPAIVFAAQANSAKGRMQYQEAMEKSAKAKTWTWAAGIGAATIWVLYVLFFVVMAAATSTAGY